MYRCNHFDCDDDAAVVDDDYDVDVDVDYCDGVVDVVVDLTLINLMINQLSHFDYCYY